MFSCRLRASAPTEGNNSFSSATRAIALILAAGIRSLEPCKHRCSACRSSISQRPADPSTGRDRALAATAKLWTLTRPGVTEDAASLSLRRFRIVGVCELGETTPPILPLAGGSQGG